MPKATSVSGGKGKGIARRSRAATTSDDVATSSPSTNPISAPQESAAEPSVAELMKHITSIRERLEVLEGRPDKFQRDNYLPWKDYFMGVACLAAMRSKDHSTVGACIVGKDKKILGIGYNGMPARCKERGTKGALPWKDNGLDEHRDSADEAWLGSKYPYVCSAASNAIQFSSGDLTGSTMYTTLYPLNECAKRISQARISKVVYLERDPKMDAATGITDMLFSRYPVIKHKKFQVQYLPNIKLHIRTTTTNDAAESRDGPSSLSDGQMGKADINWDQYHMGLACLAAERSKDSVTQVGACITDDDHKVVSLGWNGMPKGDDDLPWRKVEKLKFVCHAEFNALLHKTVASVKGCKMYVTLHPCNWCAKDIIQAGIKEVIYLDWPESKRNKKEYKAAEKLFRATEDLTYSKFDENFEETIVLKLADQPTAEQPGVA